MKFKILLLMIFLQLMAKAQTEVLLYETEIPNSKPVPNKEKHLDAGRISNITIPTLTIFEPAKEKANGAAVIICAGGAYIREAMDHEGFDVAKRMNEDGFTCFVLKYRLPNDTSMIDKTIGPLQDAQRAIQYVRENAGKWNLDKKKIGIMGFSAGGHLASTAGTHFKKSLIPNKNKTSLRPDFVILGYPVINLSDSLMHEGSRDNLLGKNPSPEMIRLYSNDLQVTKKTPPGFLFHAKDDKTVKVQNSIRFYEALRKHKVPAEIYLYEKGGHGFGLNNSTSEVKWIDLAIAWIRKEFL